MEYGEPKYGDRRLSYRDLAGAATALAARLRALGVRTGDIVGLGVDRSPDLAVGVLGIMLAGGGWLPLDPTYPQERLAYMLRDSGAGWLVVDERGAADLPAVPGMRRIPVRAEPPPAGASGKPVRLAPDDLAYVIYTSGSTGRPKGVALTHRGLANLAEAQVEPFRAGPGGRVLQFAPASFDASVFELTMALGTGATLVFGSRAALRPGPALVELLRQARITHLTVPPSVLATLPYEPLPELTTLICAGEALPGPLADRWGAGRRLFNAYGPTEATVWATLAEVEPGERRPPIGRPIRGARVVLLGPDRRPVAPGAVGELAIGGAGVARGYLGRPELTAERFVSDPERPGGRLYRTGDLARERPDGALEFLGRQDHQVKVRGIRVELDEVAAVLCEHPDVRDAVVVVDAATPRLIGYAVTGADARVLRAFAAERLPEAMVPAAIVALPALPLSPSGKVDRAALPQPDRAAMGLPTAATAPHTPTERLLTGIAGELLGTRVGRDDDLLALGAHSLAVAQLIARVRSATGNELTPVQVDRARTVATLAALIDSGPQEPVGPPLPPLRPADPGRPVPLSLPQQRIWFLEELAPGNLAYHAQATIQLRGPLLVPALEAALSELVRRHEVLRTRFVEVDGTPVQQPQPAQSVSLPVVDVPYPPPEDVVQAVLRRPIDVARPPLIRWTLLRHGPDHHTLVQVEHHLVHDGWSFAVLLDELATLYAAYAAGRPSPLPEPGLRYADFAVWQRNWMRGETLARYLAHWTHELAGAPPVLELPTDRPRPAVQSFTGAALRVPLPAELCHRLRAFGREHGVTLFATMLAGFGALLHRYTGQADLLVGTGAANRRVAELERLVGMVVNTLVLRVDAGGRPSFADLLRRVHTRVLAAHAWSDMPVERLVEELSPPRDPSRTPLFQVMFSFHDAPVPDIDAGGLTGTVVERHNGSAKTDLNIVVVPRGEQRIGRAPRAEDEDITLIWEYRSDLFYAATMRRMVTQYLTLLADATARPDTELARLRMEDAPADRDPTEVRWPAGPSVTDLVARHARTRPDAVAVSWPDGSLTYRELHERAGWVAARLRSAGVDGHAPVALLAARSPELVVGHLATMLAGAPFVPIDPTYPPRRIEYLLSDCAAAAVLAPAGSAGAAGAAGSAGSVGSASSVGSAGSVPAFGGATIPLDTGLYPGERAPCVPDRHDDDLAYVIYTSGSTGRPKGVQITHRGLANLVHWHVAEYGLGPADRATLVASPGFDASVWEIWPALAAGATLCVPPDELRSAPAELVRWLVDEQITVCFLPTPLAEAVLGERWPARGALRVLLTGGDRLRRPPPPGLPFRLVNHYGPTENTVVATATPVPPVGGSCVPPIGWPIANVRAYVVVDGEPAPVGVPGELCLGGVALARGYLGDPARTAERFVPDPFAPRPGARMYRTGDRVRRLPDGQLDFLGRADDQVKIRGFRVEPGEVAAALREHDAVSDAVVVARDDGPGGKRLVAYAVSVEDPGLLREFLATRLPPDLVPAAVVVLPALPVGPHDKVDTAALPAPARDAGRPATAARTPTERRVAELCGGLLDLDPVDIAADFFALGGHSLLASRLLAQVNRSFGTAVPLRLFLAAPTVARLAAAVDEAVTDSAGGQGAAGISPVPWRAAGQLLTDLDRLTDAEVEALLGELVDTEEEPS